MGGKTVMNFAAKYDNFEKIIVVDIAPRFYPTHHNHILAGLAAIKLDELKSRKDADDIFLNMFLTLASDNLSSKTYIEQTIINLLGE